MIETEEEYVKALKRLEEIFDTPADTAEGYEAELLVVLIGKYEDEHYPIETPDLIEAIKIRMEELGLKQNDLFSIVGGNKNVSEVLNRKRKLTIEMIKKLASLLNLSVETLMKDYPLKK